MLSKFRDQFLLEIVVFFGGAVVMIYEIIGSRIMAPYIGTSTYVWTSLIGVILGSLSLGYWLGGRMADRRPEAKLLATILFVSALLVTLTMFLQEFILAGLSMIGMRLEIKAVIAALLLFAPASVLFGFITPYAVRLKMISVEDAGKTVGRLYALSTVGSIFGTFLAGFILLPFVGSIRTLYLIAGSLFVLSILLVAFKWTAKNVAVIVLFFSAIGVNEFIYYVFARSFNLHDFDTQYNRIRIWDGNNPKGKVRVMSFDPFSTQSTMLVDSDEVVSHYVRSYHLLRHFKPDFQKTLVVGGAGYSFPKDYVQKYPGKQMEVVEIDPDLTEIARRYFRLQDHPNLRIFHEDGRIFLNQTKEKYDVVIIDAFNAMCSVPFQLTTVEAVRRMNSVLNDNGIVIVNMISAMEGEQGYFFQAEYKTYQEVFPQVEVFKLYENDNQVGMQNLILVASKSSQMSFESTDPEIVQLLKNRSSFQPDDTIAVLTDDLAPVEYYNSYAQKTMTVGGGRIKSKFDEILKKVGFE